MNDEQMAHLLQRVGQRIRETRKSRRLSIAKLAEQTGLDRSHLYRLEQGKAGNPTLLTLVSIAEGLHVKPAWLCGFDVDVPPSAPSPVSPETARVYAQTRRVYLSTLHVVGDTLKQLSETASSMSALAMQFEQSVEPSSDEH